MLTECSFFDKVVKVCKERKVASVDKTCMLSEGQKQKIRRKSVSGIYKKVSGSAVQLVQSCFAHLSPMLAS